MLHRLRTSSPKTACILHSCIHYSCVKYVHLIKYAISLLLDRYPARFVFSQRAKLRALKAVKEKLMPYTVIAKDLGMARYPSCDKNFAGSQWKLNDTETRHKQAYVKAVHRSFDQRSCVYLTIFGSTAGFVKSTHHTRKNMCRYMSVFTSHHFQHITITDTPLLLLPLGSSSSSSLLLLVVSPRAHLHVVGMLRFMSLTKTNRTCPLLFILFLSLFLSLWPFQLYFTP